MYEIETDNGLVWKMYVDHFKSLETEVKDSQQETEEDIIIPTSLEERPAATAQSNEQQPAELAEGTRKESVGTQSVTHHRLVTDISV